MALKPNLRLKQTQRIALTPALRHALETLQLPTLVLRERLMQLAEENPLIELHFEERRTANEAYGSDIAQHNPAETLTQSLQRQVGMMQLSGPALHLARFLATELDENGYLTTSDAELALHLDLPESLISEAVGALQKCEPTGIAARNLSECLALQMIERGHDDALAHLVCRHLDLLVDENWAKATALTRLPRERLITLTGEIRKLSPRPAAAFGDAALPLVPEYFVEFDELGALQVRGSHSTLPLVRLDQSLIQNLDQPGEEMAERKREAEALVAAMEFRARTVQRVILAVVTHQHRFFRDGPSALLPLTRALLAEQLSLHPSTVGRAIAHKAIEFQGKVIPLSAFLSAALALNDGQQVSAFAVQHRIRGLIGDEDPTAPLSDSQIAGILAREGVDISRRTVAKYRGCLKLPTSYQRKRRSAPR